MRYWIRKKLGCKCWEDVDLQRRLEQESLLWVQKNFPKSIKQWTNKYKEEND